MDELGVERADFVGNSMGGQVAARLGIDAPERMRRLVMIGSTPVPYTAFVPQPLEGIKLLRSYYAGEGPSRDKMRRLLETIVYDSSALTDEIVDARYQASIDPELVQLQAGGNLFEPENLLADLPRLKAPTLLVWGQDDRFGALDAGFLMLRAFPDARMHVFGRCGHWAQVERADEFNRLVLDFLDQGRAED
jgi:4,5:9,10-diseco-3-hydroxy-5,9,17-trioxoandrosta-1(10),2-diene-4-oate hydrolase